jgi:hypothetical protein
MNGTKRVVGQHDEKHRMFLGWKVVIGKGSSDRFELDPDGSWYHIAGIWTDFEKARSAVRQENTRPNRGPDEHKAKLIPIYRLESAAREAIRFVLEDVKRFNGAISKPTLDFIQLALDEP